MVRVQIASVGRGIGPVGDMEPQGARGHPQEAKLTLAEAEDGAKPLRKGFSLDSSCSELQKGGFRDTIKESSVCVIWTQGPPQPRELAALRQKFNKAKWHQGPTNVELNGVSAIPFMRGDSPSGLSIPWLWVCSRRLSSYSMTWLLIVLV